jgi:hypothetical protein
VPDRRSPSQRRTQNISRLDKLGMYPDYAPSQSSPCR